MGLCNNGCNTYQKPMLLPTYLQHPIWFNYTTIVKGEPCEVLYEARYVAKGCSRIYGVDYLKTLLMHVAAQYELYTKWTRNEHMSKLSVKYTLISVLDTNN